MKISQGIQKVVISFLDVNVLNGLDGHNRMKIRMEIRVRLLDRKQLYLSHDFIPLNRISQVGGL